MPRLCWRSLPNHKKGDPGSPATEKTLPIAEIDRQGGGEIGVFDGDVTFAWIDTNPSEPGFSLK